MVYAGPSAAAPDLAAGFAAAGASSLGGRGPGRGLWAGERVGVEREDGSGEGLLAEAASIRVRAGRGGGGQRHQTAASGKKKGGKNRKKKKKKKKKPKPVALRAENLVVRHCKACGKVRGVTKLLACGGCGLAHYCGARVVRRRRGVRHKSFCKFARKEKEKADVKAAAKAAAALAAAKAKAAKSSAAAASGSGGAGIGAGRGCGGGDTSEVSAHSENRRQGGATDPSLGPANMGASPPSPFAHVELWEAALDGEVAKVGRLLKGGADVNFVHQGGTPLFVAAQNNHTAVIKLLLENKAEVDKADNNGCTLFTSQLTRPCGCHAAFPEPRSRGGSD